METDQTFKCWGWVGWALRNPWPKKEWLVPLQLLGSLRLNQWCAIPAKIDSDSIPIPGQWCSIQFQFQFHHRKYWFDSIPIPIPPLIIFVQCNSDSNSVEFRFQFRFQPYHFKYTSPAGIDRFRFQFHRVSIQFRFQFLLVILASDSIPIPIPSCNLSLRFNSDSNSSIPQSPWNLIPIPILESELHIIGLNWRLVQYCPKRNVWSFLPPQNGNRPNIEMLGMGGLGSKESFRQKNWKTHTEHWTTLNHLVFYFRLMSLSAP